MKRWLCLSVAFLAAFAALPAAAHEFWMLPASFVVSPGGKTSLTLASGEDFRGARVTFSAPVVAALRHYSAGQVADLRSRIPAKGELRELPLAFPKPGTHVIAFDTHPSSITLEGEKFQAYLRGEGLEPIAEKREASGKAASPGRERFRRNIKTLVQVGDQPDATYKRRTGQRLEIVPLVNPFTKRAGDEVGFQVLFDGKPLSRALLQAWHKQGGQTSIIKTKTDARGRAKVALPLPGAWMVSVVHMVPARNTPDHDWDSYWGNLTFALRDPKD
jgi:uncharacterized GH25 family protein